MAQIMRICIGPDCLQRDDYDGPLLYEVCLRSDEIVWVHHMKHVPNEPQPCLWIPRANHMASRRLTDAEMEAVAGMHMPAAKDWILEELGR
jgi:hypothetical protein